MNFDSDFDADWPAVEARWQLESELHAAPPRRAISLAPKTGCGARIGNSCLGCGLIAMFVLGFLLSLWAGLAVLILPFGNTVDGTITAHRLTNSRSPRYGKSQSYMLQFEFVPHGAAHKYRGEWPVNIETFDDLRNGDEAIIRYFPFAPGLRPVLEAGTSPWLHILLLGPLGLLMLVIGGAPLTGLLPQSRVVKRLVQRGIAAPGVVVELKRGNVTFWFRVHNAQGETRTVESQHLNVPLCGLQPGQTVTVLFAARRPERAIIYEICGWRAQI